MVETAVLQIAGSLGVGALLSVVIFFMYRRDKEASEKRIIDICIGHENRLRDDRQLLINIVEGDRESREANTKAITDMTKVLERMNGRK